MLYYNNRALLRYNNSSTIPCTKPRFFPSKFRKISLFVKVLKNLRAISNRVKKKHYLAIVLPNSIAARMPYLPAKDELVSLDRLSSRGLWKWYNSKGFGRATIWRGAAFHFLAVFSKMKILWKLWLWFSKMFHQRVLSDWKWSISRFQFWRRIHDIYRQQLLTERETIQANNFDRVKDFLCWTIWMGSIAHLPRKKTSRTLIKVRFTLHLAVRELIKQQRRQWLQKPDLNREFTLLQTLDRAYFISFNSSNLGKFF